MKKHQRYLRPPPPWICLTWALVLWGSLLSRPLEAGLAVFAWEKVDSADHSHLVVSLGDKTFFIRTPDSHIYLDAAAHIRIVVYGRNREILGWPLPLKMAFIPPAVSDLAALDLAALDLAALDLAAPKRASFLPSVVAASGVGVPVVRVPVHKEADQRQVVATLKMQPKLSKASKQEAARLAKLAAEEKEAFSSSPFRFLDVSLALGQENIEARGGSSRFNGRSGIAGASLGFHADLAKRRSKLGSLIGIKAKFHLHDFMATKLVKVENSTASDKQTLALSRNYGLLTLQHQLARISSTTLLASYGLGYFAGALMATSNSENGDAELAERGLMGLILAAGTRTSFTKKVTVFSEAQLLPLLYLGKSKGQRWQLQVDSRYFFLPAFYSSIALSRSEERVEGKLSCPESALNCRKDALTTSVSSLMHIGLGLFF